MFPIQRAVDVRDCSAKGGVNFPEFAASFAAEPFLVPDLLYPGTAASQVSMIRTSPIEV